MLALGRGENKYAELLLDGVGGVLRLLTDVALKAFVSDRMLPGKTEIVRTLSGHVRAQNMHRNLKYTDVS